jgi:hypothetical protein
MYIAIRREIMYKYIVAFPYVKIWVELGPKMNKKEN